MEGFFEELFHSVLFDPKRGNLLSRADAAWALGTGIAAGLGVPILGGVIKGAGMLYAGTMGVSTISGTVHGITTGDWRQLGNTAKLFAGNFYLDGNRSFFGQVWQGISRFSWELPLSI